MSTLPTRRTPHLLSRILEQRDLVTAVQALPPQALGRLVHEVGLEDAGELVALATTEQLSRIFDDDLWHSDQAGVDEAFDPERFGLWLQVMLEAGADFVARRLVELDPDLVTLGMLHLILVVDQDALAEDLLTQRQDVELTDKALESSLTLEMDAYLLIARQPHAWDAVVDVLLALDQNHQHFAQQVLDRCCAISADKVEDSGGLYNLLSAEEMLEGDAAADRSDRRALEGYIAPSDALSLLRLIRSTPLAEIVAAPERDPVTRAYFRELADVAKTDVKSNSYITNSRPGRAPDPTPEPATSRLISILEQAGLWQPDRPALLAASPADAGEASAASAMERALAELLQQDAATYAQRMGELAYLGNVLAAGCSVEGRRLRPMEAAEAALAACGLGLERVLEQGRDDAGLQSATATLVRHGADFLFRVGWRLLHERVTLASGAAVLRILRAAGRRSPDLVDNPAFAQADLALRAAIVKGEPWTARGQLTALGLLLDGDAVDALQVLLDECPRLPALLQEDDAATAPVSFTTSAQLRRIATWLKGLAVSHGA